MPRVQGFIAAAGSIEREHAHIYGHTADRYNDRPKALAILKVCACSLLINRHRTTHPADCVQMLSGMAK